MDASPPKAPCWDCGLLIDKADRYCRGCGKGQGGHIHWYYRHWGILVLTLGLGPFSLYFVRRSPILSSGAKWAYTAGIALMTVWFCVQCYRVWQVAQAIAQAYLQGMHFQ